MMARSWSARNKRDLIIEVWEYLDCESVGASELEQIQQALTEKFGAGALTSPASIARTVADEGAALRHPEVFQCDLKWREQNLKKWEFREELDFSDDVVLLRLTDDGRGFDRCALRFCRR